MSGICRNGLPDTAGNNDRECLGFKTKVVQQSCDSVIVSVNDIIRVSGE